MTLAEALKEAARELRDRAFLMEPQVGTNIQGHLLLEVAKTIERAAELLIKNGNTE